MKTIFLVLAALLLLASSALGARQTLLDGETMLSIRTKINANFTEIYGWGNHAGLYSLLDHGHASYLADAPTDGKQYARQDGLWAEVVGGGIDGTTLDGGGASAATQAIYDGGGAQ